VSVGHDPVHPPLTLATVLVHHGLPDSAPEMVEAHRNHRGLWRIKFNYDETEPLSMDTTQASLLAGHLRHIGEAALADEIEGAIRQAERYRTM